MESKIEDMELGVFFDLLVAFLGLAVEVIEPRPPPDAFFLGFLVAPPTSLRKSRN